MKKYNYFYILIIISFLSSCSDKGDLKKIEEFDENGQLSKVYFVDDKEQKQGQFIEYFENSKVKLLCNYINDTLNGDYVQFTELGKVSFIYGMLNGVKHGTYIGFDQLGSINALEIYDNDQVMKSTFYYDNGKVRRLASYSAPRGVFNSDIYFDKGGKIIDSISHYCNIDFFNDDSISISLEDYLLETDLVDSIQVDIKSSFRDDKIIRTIKNESSARIAFDLEKGDYFDDTLRIVLKWYKIPKRSDNPNVYYPPTRNIRQIELIKGQTPSKYNVNPIW